MTKPSRRNRRIGVAHPPVIKTPRMRPRLPIFEDPKAAVTVRLVRFMDDYFGAGNWELKAGEPEENKILRDLAQAAFMAGAGVD